MQPKHLPRDIADRVRTATKQRGKRQIAREAGLSNMTIARALEGHPVTDETLVALARIAPKTRTADEFAGKVGAPPIAPRMHSGPYSWDLSLIRAARDDQMRGRFEMPVRLAEAMRCDDALFTARRNRIAPQASVQTKLTPASGARGAAVLARAKQSVFISRSVLEGINGTLADHGIAIGVIDHEPTEDGTRIDFRLKEWPLEHVRWNESTETLETRDRSGNTIPIVHGDGTWVVFRKYLTKPWTQEACILPGALIWAAHAEGIADWSGASRAHGLAKIVGMLPEGVSLNEAGGELTPEARTFLQMMQGLASGDAVAGVRPAGSEVDFLSNGSTAWQVFAELLINREKAAARIYNGTDAALGSVGGAPGVDIAALFNIASSIIQGDFSAIETALNTGVYEPWCAVNEGTSRYAPRFEYELPDADAAAKAKERQEKRAAFFDAIEKMRDSKLVVNQAVINQLAADYGVIPAPMLAAEDQQTSTLVLAPTDIAKVVRVREARAAQGLPPFGDERDNMTINELDAWLQAKNTPAPAPAAP